MGEEWQPEAVLRVKLDQLKREFLDYIDKNIDKIDVNIPVFYGYVISAIEKTVPDISDDLYDRFIDTITLAVLEKSKKTDDITVVEKLFDYAIRNKRRQKGRAVYDIRLGMRLINNGKYAEAIEQLKKYRPIDAIICPAIAYCYFVLSTQQSGIDPDDARHRPNDMSLAAREQMIELIRIKPPVNRLKDMEIADDPGINKIFWFMINQAIAWFPSEREFIRIGIEKASRDQDRAVKEDLLKIGIERFYNDMDFLRELYNLKLESRDAGGVAGVIRQMTQQYPDDLEPVYYGMKLSIVTARVETYYHFRKIAIQKNIPAQAILLLDFAFEIMAGKLFEAHACMDEIRVKFGPQHYFVILLEYVANDFFSEDEKRVRRSKKALVDAVDQYCLKLLKIGS
ncbi:MAG: hypothetical protein WC391_08110 [Methanoregula sp.]|jgi:hypothetical protein